MTWRCAAEVAVLGFEDGSSGLRRSLKTRLVGMRRFALAMGGVMLAFGGLWVAAMLLPGVISCPSVECGDLDSKAIDLLGRQNFTLVQTTVIAAVVVGGGSLVSAAALPRRSTCAAVGAGILGLMVVLSLALPPHVAGEAPTRPCSTPGPNGPIEGECVTGRAPLDGRLVERAGLLALGLAALGVGWLADRQRTKPGTRSLVPLAQSSGP